MTFAIDSKECRVMMSSTKGSFSVHEVSKLITKCCSIVHCIALFLIASVIIVPSVSDLLLV